MNTKNFCTGYEQLHVKLIRVANKILWDLEESRDVVASVLSQTFEKKKSIDEATFENFMTISVRNKAVDVLRARKFRKTILVPAFHEDAVVCDEDFSSFDEKELSYELNKAIEELPPVQKKLIRLKYLEEMDRKTITKVCNSNEFSVRNNLASGLKNLRLKMLNKRNAQ